MNHQTATRDSSWGAGRAERPAGVVLAAGAALFVLIGVLLIAPGANAASNTIRIDPATQSVSQGSSFQVHVIAHPTVATSGVQATVTFDRTKLNVTAVAFGAPWTGAGASTQPGNLASAISTANSKGKLVQFAAFFLDGTTSIPAGDADFLDITFTAVGCGTATLGLPIGSTGAQMLDGGAHYGNTIAVSTTSATVSIAGSCAGGGGPTPAGTTPGGAQSSAPGQSIGELPSAGPTDTGVPGSEVPLASSESTLGPILESPGSSQSIGAVIPTSSSDGGSPVLIIGLIALAAVAGAVVGFASYRRRGGAGRLA